jgi:hypothetical protein
VRNSFTRVRCTLGVFSFKGVIPFDRDAPREKPGFAFSSGYSPLNEPVRQGMVPVPGPRDPRETSSLGNFISRMRITWE